ncbi:MAG: hypothetical protein KJN79_09325 [Gammaproteobacteria bacterium]|nr:hypothetical protein [Gammaproteobacteria bacterium]
MTWGVSVWGVDNWGAAGGGGGLSVAPLQVSAIGGETLVATGTFSITTPVTVHLGPLGTADDPLCYGGQGLAYEVLSLDGTTIEFVSPPLAKGSVSLTVVGPSTQTVGGITVVERSWPGKLHAVRRSFSPWASVGGRHLRSEVAQ